MHRSRRAALVLLGSAAISLSAQRRSRVFNASLDAVWSAAVNAAKNGFMLDKATREEHKLSFRSGPFRRYRFDVAVTPAGAVQTRVEVELRTNLYSVEKGAARDGDRYLEMVADGLRSAGGKR